MTTKLAIYVLRNTFCHKINIFKLYAAPLLNRKDSVGSHGFSFEKCSFNTNKNISICHILLIFLHLIYFISGKSFRQRVSFLVHTRIHTGVMPYKCELCQKSFRYKVSQRTHKCQSLSTEETGTSLANETLDQISETFIKAFLENSTNPIQMQQQLSQQNSPASNEIAVINKKASANSIAPTSSPPVSSLNEHQALLSKAIDDIVVESCNKLGIGNRTDNGGFSSPIQNINDGSMSPSQKLQNMRLYSPQLVASPDLNSIDGDLTRFFLENSTAGQNIL